MALIHPLKLSTRLERLVNSVSSLRFIPRISWHEFHTINFDGPCSSSSSMSAIRRTRLCTWFCLSVDSVWHSRLCSCGYPDSDMLEAHSNVSVFLSPFLLANWLLTEYSLSSPVFRLNFVNLSYWSLLNVVSAQVPLWTSESEVWTGAISSVQSAIGHHWNGFSET